MGKISDRYILLKKETSFAILSGQGIINLLPSCHNPVSVRVYVTYSIERDGVWENIYQSSVSRVFWKQSPENDDWQSLHKYILVCIRPKYYFRSQHFRGFLRMSAYYSAPPSNRDSLGVDGLCDIFESCSAMHLWTPNQTGTHIPWSFRSTYFPTYKTSSNIVCLTSLYPATPDSAAYGRLSSTKE